MTADNKTLATFRIEETKWVAFKEKCRMAGATASETLNNFVESYISGNEELPGGALHRPTVPSDMPSRLESIEKRLISLENIEQRLASLESIQSGELVA